MRNRISKKLLYCLLAIALVCLAYSVLPTSAAQASELKLPSGLKRIEAQAFYGDTSLDTVTVQEGTEVIGKEAFANSSAQAVTLPRSLYSIADDAFSGCENLTVNAQEGTYAYTWAVKNKYINIPDGEAGAVTQVIAPETLRAGADLTIQIIGPSDTIHHSVYIVNEQTEEYQIRESTKARDTITFGGYNFESGNTYRLTVYTVTKQYQSLTPVRKQLQVTGQKPAATLSLDLPDSMTTCRHYWFENDIDYPLHIIVKSFSLDGTNIDSREELISAKESYDISTRPFINNEDGGTIQILYSFFIDGLWCSNQQKTVTATKYQLEANIISFPETIENGNDFGVIFECSNRIVYYSYSIISSETSQYAAGNERGFDDYSEICIIPIQTQNLDQGRYTLCIDFLPEGGYDYIRVCQKDFEVVGTRSRAPQILAGDQEIFGNSYTDFLISSEGASKAAMHVVNAESGYAEDYIHDVYSNQTWCGTWFYEGVYNLTFAVCRNGRWSAWSDPVTLTVKKKSTLASPSINVTTPILAGTDLSFSFNEVNNAEYYQAHLKKSYGGDPVYSLLPATPTDLQEIPGYDITSGNYVLEVEALAEGYETSHKIQYITANENLNRPASPVIIAPESIYSNQYVTFNFDTADADALQIKYWDDEYWSEPTSISIPVTEDQTEWTVWIGSYKQGYTLSVSYSARINGVWSVWETQEYLISGYQSPSPAVIHVDETIQAGKDFSIIVDPVPNAYRYECRLYNENGVSVWQKNYYSSIDENYFDSRNYESGIYTFKVWTYASNGTFSLNEKTFTIIGNKPAIPTIQVNKTSVKARELFTFTIETDNVEDLEYSINNNDLSKIKVFENETQWTTYSNYGGTYQYRFSVKQNGVWSSWSQPIVITVSEYVRPASPAIAVTSPLQSGRDLIVSLSNIENATRYTVYLDKEDNTLSLRCDVYPNNELAASFPGYRLTPGTYQIRAYVYDGYTSSEKTYLTIVLTASDQPEAPIVTQPENTTVQSGSYITFTIDTTGADMIAYRNFVPGYTNDIDYSTHTVQEGQTETSWRMYFNDSIRKYSFAVRKNGIWSEWSGFITITAAQNNE